MCLERLLQVSADGLTRVAASLSGDLLACVQSLLEEPQPTGTLVRPLALAAFVTLALFTVSDPLYHATESLLGAVTC